MKGNTFRDIISAPKDGTIIEVRHGPEQEIARATWSRQTWVRADDPMRWTLYQVTGWRPMA